MKKIVIVLIFTFVCTSLFAADISALLDSAKKEYAAGNLNGAIQKIDEAKKTIELETLAKTKNTYIEVKNWDEVTLKAKTYLGKKVKFRTKYYGINATDAIAIGHVLPLCTFEPSLVDTILGLEERTEYTFYGTVVVPQSKYGEAKLHIEKIEK